MNFNYFAFISVLISFYASPISGQVTFSKVPKKLQLYGRNLITDSAVVTIEGSVKKSGINYSEVRCRVFRNSIQRNIVSATLNYTGDNATFSLKPLIYAELASYRFDIYGYDGSQETLIRSVDSVLCGDALIISGQSNAVARNHEGGSANGNQSPYIRVLGTGSEYGSDSVWRIGEGDGDQNTLGNTGQWGLRLARLIVDNQKIPVAIFNGALDGKWIQFFKRNDANPADPNTNYGRLLLRVRAAGMTQNIRALIWHQGESNAYADGNSLSISGYKSAIQTLIGNWQTDFRPIQKLYVFQIRSGCSCPDDSALNIKEAQRQLAQMPIVSLMSTSAQTHSGDNCHYHYNNGYQQFGENIYRLLRRDLYGINATNIDAPFIKFAEIGNNGQTLKIIMEDIMDSISWVNGSQADFRFTGATPAISGGACSGNTVLLTLGSNGNGITGVSFNGHQNTPEPMIKNLNGVGALHFKNFPITTPRYRDSVSLAAILKANNITLLIDSFAVFSSSGRIVTLKLSDRKITKLHPYIGFMDSLKTIDLTGNMLTTLPFEITKITPANVVVNYNHLCSISDTIKTWINRYAKDVNWQAKQLLDSLHLCNGEVATEFRSLKEMATSINNQLIQISVRGKCLFLSFAKPEDVTSIKVLKLNGSVVRQFDHASNTMKIDLKDLSASNHFIQVTRSSQIQTTKWIPFF